MNRAPLSLFVFAFILTSAQSQEPPKAPNPPHCNLTVAQAPAIRGIVKLGASTQELMSVFPASSEEIKHSSDRSEGYPTFGVARVYIGTENDSERFAGTRSLEVTIFDGRVAEIRVAYQEYPHGAGSLNVDDFIAKLSQAFALSPAGEWDPTGGQSKHLTCRGFEITAAISHDDGAGLLILSNSAYKAVVQERAAEDKDKKRKEFKP